MGAGARAAVERILARADIRIGGGRPFDVRVHDERFFDRLLREGSLGAGESYMQGWWDCAALDEAIARVFRAGVLDALPRDWPTLVTAIRSRLLNLQRLRPREVGEKHYDIGNELYAAMLDKRMIYSCGYWPNATTLEEAQEAKLDLICRKLMLQPGMALLDIGSGWGGLIQFAAERHGVRATGVTVSREQAAWADARKGALPVETKVMDYMALTGRFPRIVSVGMFEHVGYKNYRRFFEKVASLIEDDGIFLLHTISGNLSVTHPDPWFEKYIFPNSMLPSPRQIAEASEGLFVTEDVQNFGPDYDRTLMAWHANIEAAWEKLPQFDERFRRMWRYYLLTMAGTFRARSINLLQFVFSRRGLDAAYRAPR